MENAQEHPTAEFLVWIATSDKDGHKLFDPAPQSAFAIVCRKRDWSLVGSQTSNGSAAASDYNARALVIAANIALQRMPAGASIHIITDQDWFSGMLNDSRSERMKRNYMRPNLKSKYSYENEWRQLDLTANERGLKLSSSRPITEAEKREMAEVKEAASQCARNIGRPHSDWDI